MSSYYCLLYVILLTHIFTPSLMEESEEEATIKSIESVQGDDAPKLININTLSDNCQEDGVCRNFYFPNKSKIALFELKPQIRILEDMTTYNYENPLKVNVLVFKNSTFAHFPLNFFNSVSVQELDMRNCSIEAITWENFIMAKNLNVLLLSQNKINEIMEMTFSHASDLQYLFLDTNRIRKLVSESFKGLSSLRYLDLSFNRLKYLPGTVFDYLPMLNELNLAGNGLKYLPNEIFSRNTKLTSVVLRDNRLRVLDEYLFRNQANLVFFDISNNVFLSRLIMNLRTKYLIASNCSLYQVNLYGQVVNADFCDNKIIEIYFSEPESLENLVLRNNALKQIDSLARAINLQELDIADNPGLEYMPDPWSVNSLERLDLSNTSLRQLPISNLAEQKKLSLLNVSNNRLQEINPINYKYLEKLTKFYIEQNDWNCYSLRPLMDLLIRPNRIAYKHDRFDESFPGEYVEGIACMYRLEDEDENEDNPNENCLNGLLECNKPISISASEQLTQETNEYPTKGNTEDNFLKLEVESLRKELKAIVSFYESKFDKMTRQIEDLNQRCNAIERLILQDITIMT